GILARNASSTELRPVTTSGPLPESDCRGRGARWVFCAASVLRPPRFSARRSWAALRLPAGWYGRSSALGVGPLPSSACLPWPPEPTCGPLRPLRTAPARGFLPLLFMSTHLIVGAIAPVNPLPASNARRWGCL